MENLNKNNIEETNESTEKNVREKALQNYVYRWNINDENNIKTKGKPKKAKRNFGLKLFASIMSVMFLFTAATTAYLVYDYFNPGIIEAIGEKSADIPKTPVISNQNAVDETQNGNLENTSILIPSGSSGSKFLTTEEAIAKVNPAVVCVEVEEEVQGYQNFFGGRSSTPYISYGIGTGFIVSEDGYIATNYHVVGTASKITVTLFDGKTYPAELIGGDEAADLAVIKIKAKNLTVAELGDSDSLVQGQDVVAIGTPAGMEFAWTATKGIVSAVSRIVDVSDRNKQNTMTVIQTDASINNGNSGGPLINMKGEVIGINSLKLASSQYEGMGFAIPINIAIPTFNNIIENPGNITKIPSAESAADLSKVSFGLEGFTVTQEDSIEYNIPQGWKISKINENGPSYNSGLQPSDIIVALDNSEVKSLEDMYSLKLKYKPGDKVTVTIYRNGDLHEFTVTLGEK